MARNQRIPVAIPPAMLKEVDALAKSEFRTRSNLVREALRRYIKSHWNNNYPPMIVSVKGADGSLITEVKKADEQ